MVPVQVSSAVQVRILPSSEWGRLKSTGGALEGEDLQPTDQARIIVAEQDGRIVGYWVLMNVVHAEPIWIAPDARHSLGVVKGLLDRVMQTLQAEGITQVFTTIADDQPAVASVARRVGFVPIPGQLYGALVKEG